MNLKSRTHCIVMAGGSGTRFWPKSRTLKPKQLIELSGSGKTLIEETVTRINDLCSSKNIHIVTGEKISTPVKKIFSKNKQINIIAEPKGRNTAPCIGYMAARISNFSDPDDIMVIMPSDHLIKETKKFLTVLRTAVEAASKYDCFVTVGIPPRSPHTGYGYIQTDKQIKKSLYKVRTFKEKPDLKTAKEFVKKGCYLWNAGIFAVKASVALKEIKKHMPGLYSGINEISKTFGTKTENQAFKKLFPLLEAQSIDYGVIEKLKNTLTVKADFSWDDLGSWTSVEPLRSKKAFGVSNTDNVIWLNASSNIIDCYSDKKLIALLGVKDLIIIETPDVLLVADRNSDQKIKEMVEELKRKKKNEFL